MPTATRPNILFVCSDQQHWQMNSVNGHPLVRTPNLERLAARGTNFRCCYSNSPVCVPSRAAMFTGMYPSDVGAYDNAAPFDGRVPTFGNVARDAGYFCTASGKLDFHYNTDFGFEEIGTSHGHDPSPDITAYFRRPLCNRIMDSVNLPNVIREGPPRDLGIMQQTASFLREQSAKVGGPWLAYSGWVKPHNPYTTSREMLSTYPLGQIDLPMTPHFWRDTEHPVMFMTRYNRRSIHTIGEQYHRRCRAAYYGMITELDQMLGTLLDELERSGQMENTVVIYTSDHGDMMGEHGMYWKNTAYDDCARIPLIIAGPGFPAGKVVETPVSTVDIAATVMDVACGQAPEGMRGASLVPLAHGDDSQHQGVYLELNTESLPTGLFFIRAGDWKYNYYVDYPDQLFNLASDPGEWSDLSGLPECQEIRQEMRRLLFTTVDPERISDEAFADQDRRFAAMLDGWTYETATADPDFFNQFKARLGEQQAHERLAHVFAARERAGAGSD